MRRSWWLMCAVACDGTTDEATLPTDATDSTDLPAFEAPDAWGGTAGPGGPSASHEESALFEACAYLTGDAERTAEHHNLVVMYDGYAILPWAPEDGVQRWLDLRDEEAWTGEADPTPEAPQGISDEPGVFGGGVSVYDLSDPCAPVKVGEGWSPWMRESHSLGFREVDGKTYMAVDYLALDGSGGVGFWDMTDMTAPTWVSQIALPEHVYPDSYTRLTLSVFWQGDIVYASTAFLGIFMSGCLGSAETPRWSTTTTRRREIAATTPSGR